MKYFAKWLPVEGEISGDDAYIKIHKPDTVYKNGEINYGGLSVKTTKVKLHLCAHNVTPEIMLGGGSSVYWLHDPKDANEERPFKVIGEISKDALWIKENDEFDESEIEQVTYERYWNDASFENRHELLKDSYNGLFDKIVREDRKYGLIVVAVKEYKIKGPCGHFH